MNEFKQAPAFDFYPERWTHGTRGMSKVERCDYLDLLCHQWTEDGIVDDLETICRILGYKKPSQIPRAVIVKFPVAEDGKRRNKRLETERRKQKERFQKKSLGASKTNAKRWGKESLSDQLAIPNGVANASPPPTSDLRPPNSIHPAREGVVSESPPTVDDVLGYAKGNAAGALRTDVCMAWIDARERDGWKREGRNGNMIEFEDWRADLRTFHRIFLENESDKKGRGGNRPPLIGARQLSKTEGPF